MPTLSRNTVSDIKRMKIVDEARAEIAQIEIDLEAMRITLRRLQTEIAKKKATQRQLLKRRRS